MRGRTGYLCMMCTVPSDVPIAQDMVCVHKRMDLVSVSR